MRFAHEQSEKELLNVDTIYLLPGEERYVDFQDANGVPAVKSSDEFAKEKTLPVKKTRRVTIINVISCEFSILD